MKTTLTRAAIVLLAAAATPLAAQQIKVGAKVGEAPATAGSYDSRGHRDPFVTLVAPRRAGNPNAPRLGTGLQSMFVAEVTVTGITKAGPDKWMAFLQSPDRQSYVAKVKDRLSDAVIKSIDAHGVVFLEVNEPGVTSRPREIRKLLRPLNEVNR